LPRTQCVDSGVPCHVYLALDALQEQIGCRSFAWGKQQVRPSIDGPAIFLLRPGKERIMCP